MCVRSTSMCMFTCSCVTSTLTCKLTQWDTVRGSHGECIFEISDEVNASGRARATSNLMVFKLVSTEGGHAGLDASRSQGNEQQPHHGQSSVGTTQHRHSVSISVCVHLLRFGHTNPSVRSTHMCKVMSSGVPSLL